MIRQDQEKCSVLCLYEIWDISGIYVYIVLPTNNFCFLFKKFSGIASLVNIAYIMTSNILQVL